MDLYEALKSGISSEELENAFRRDLQKAEARLEQEKEAVAKKVRLENLGRARNKFASATITYLNALLLDNADAAVSPEEIQKVKDNILEPFEKEMTAYKRLYNNSKETTKKQERTDDEVIQNFLNTLL